MHVTCESVPNDSVLPVLGEHGARERDLEAWQ